MAKKSSPPNRASNNTRSAAQNPPRRGGQDRQSPSRRNDVIRCENCGEDYSVTYRCCPFCDERPGRTGVNGRRVDEGGQASPVQVVWLVATLILIIVAMFIVFKYVGPLIFGRNTTVDSSSQVSTSQSTPVSGSQTDASQSSSSSSSEGPDQSDPSKPLMLTLDKSDVTLPYGTEFTLAAEVLPMDVTQPVVWTSSHPDVAQVDADGLVRNVNKGTDKVKTTITATCGDLSASCTVYCSAEVVEPSIAGKTGTIKNAASGLNVRSGPGTDYRKVGTLFTGDKVTIQEETNGWYKVKLSNGYVGYVSSKYVNVR